jgi:hypothetical protein
MTAGTGSRLRRMSKCVRLVTCGASRMFSVSSMVAGSLCVTLGACESHTRMLVARVRRVTRQAGVAVDGWMSRRDCRVTVLTSAVVGLFDAVRVMTILARVLSFRVVLPNYVLSAVATATILHLLNREAVRAVTVCAALMTSCKQCVRLVVTLRATLLCECCGCMGRMTVDAVVRRSPGHGGVLVVAGNVTRQTGLGCNGRCIVRVMALTARLLCVCFDRMQLALRQFVTANACPRVVRLADAEAVTRSAVGRL